MRYTFISKIIIALLVLAFWQDSGWHFAADAALSPSENYISQPVDSADPPEFSLTSWQNNAVFKMIYLSLPRSIHPEITEQRKTAVLPPRYLFLPNLHQKPLLNLQPLSCFSLQSDDPHPIAA